MIPFFRICLLLSSLQASCAVSMAADSPLELISLPKAVSIRAMHVLPNADSADDTVIWVSGTERSVFRSTDSGATWQDCSVKNTVPTDADFRSLHAWDDRRAVVAVAGQPAVVMKTIDGGKSWSQVFHEKDKSAFIDGIEFYDERTGFLFGDPVDGRWMVAMTRDAGASWKSLPTDQLPLAEKAEAGFAASDTSMVVSDQLILIGSGGKESDRATILRGEISDESEGLSVRWSRVTCPIASSQRQGVFSISRCSWDLDMMLAVGGDYQPEHERVPTTVVSHDAGKTWKLLEHAPKSFQSCVSIGRCDDGGYVAVSVGNAPEKRSTMHASLNGNSWFDVPAPEGLQDPGFHGVKIGKRYVYAVGAYGQFARAKIDKLIALSASE